MLLGCIHSSIHSDSWALPMGSVTEAFSNDAFMTCLCLMHGCVAQHRM